MAQKFLTNIDLNRNQLINSSFEVLASDPSTNLFDGRMYFNSAEVLLKSTTQPPPHGERLLPVLARLLV